MRRDAPKPPAPRPLDWAGRRFSICRLLEVSRALYLRLPACLLGLLLMIYKSMLAALAALALASCSGPGKVSQVGYFKSSTNDRVISCRMNAGAMAEDVRAFAEDRPYTPGQMTAVYCYEQGAIIPADGLTLAETLIEANEVLDTPGLSAWRFAFMRYLNGASKFVDCEATPTDDLCRQN